MFSKYSQLPVLSGRSSKLFEDLERRALTDKEEKIIAERVALQRSLLQQFETREKRRKVSSMGLFGLERHEQLSTSAEPCRSRKFRRSAQTSQTVKQILL